MLEGESIVKDIDCKGRISLVELELGNMELNIPSEKEVNDCLLFRD